MQKELLIPYALDAETGCRISAADIGVSLADARSTLRLQATARHDTYDRKAKALHCPACFGRIYPHAPTKPSGRYYWSHRAGDAQHCPLERKTPLTLDEIGRLIFGGRQEGDAHKDLVALLIRMAERDPGTEAGSATKGQYEAPSSEMREEFPYGRFPDVKFVNGGKRVVIEAQLATIALNAINGRRAFYDRTGQHLIWVTRAFEPSVIRASLRDILADQKGVLFSIDREVEELSESDGRFRLRAWTYDYTSSGEEQWHREILTLDQALNLPSMLPWNRRFKDKWVSIFARRSFSEISNETLRELYIQLTDHCHLEPLDEQDSWYTLHLVNLLISLEIGEVLGAKHGRLVSLVHSALDSRRQQHAAALVRRALDHWQNTLARDPKISAKLDRLRETVPQSGRSSRLGAIRARLFPDWVLPSPNGR